MRLPGRYPPHGFYPFHLREIRCIVRRAPYQLHCAQQACLLWYQRGNAGIGRKSILLRQSAKCATSCRTITWESQAPAGWRPVHFLVYARHGRELMGCKSPMCESGHCLMTLTQTLADGKGVSVRKGLKEARVQSYEPTDRNSI